jgi:hypothetical protein
MSLFLILVISSRITNEASIEYGNRGLISKNLDNDEISKTDNFYQPLLSRRQLNYINNTNNPFSNKIHNKVKTILQENSCTNQTIQQMPLIQYKKLNNDEYLNKDVVYSVTTDSSTNIVVTGSFYNSETNSSDTYLSKFSSQGDWLWSQYLIGDSIDYGTDVAVDNQDNIIIVGTTFSTDFPIKSSMIKNNSLGNDIFIAKFSSSGMKMWCTLLGGIASEAGITSLAIDSQDNLIVVGLTDSADFQIIDAEYASFNGEVDTFIAKINENGSLIWSTYLGGSALEGGEGNLYLYTPEHSIRNDVIVDSKDDIIVSSVTESTDFPTLEAYQANHGGGRDIFLSKFNSTGSPLWSTYLGGNNTEYGASLTVDHNDQIIVAGGTSSINFPTLEAYQANYNGGIDSFLSKFSTTGELLWSTFLGGKREDRDLSVAADIENSIYVTGFTKSDDYITTEGAFEDTFSGGSELGDTFVTKFSASGHLVWSTFIGGENNEAGTEITIDNENHLIIAGNTDSEGLEPINVSYPYSFGGPVDGFMATFRTTGEVIWITRALIVTEPNSDQSDEDGLTNLEEFQYQTDPLDPDTDRDSMEDGGEITVGLDPRTDDAWADLDTDGLANIVEFWTNGKLNVTNHDTDGDLMPDGWELKMQLNPTLNDSYKDRDFDGLPNLWEYNYNLNADNSSDANEDPDEDNLVNLDEFHNGLDPLNPDYDADGLPDGWEVKYHLNPRDHTDAQEDSDGDGFPNILEYQLNFDPQSPHEIFAFIFLIITLLCLVGGFFLRKRKLNQEAVRLGFENNADKKAAFKAGFKSAKKRLNAKNGGLLTAEIYNIVRAAGWLNVEEMVADWDNELSTIRKKLTDEDIQDVIQLIPESSSPPHLSRLVSELTPLFDEIEKNYRRVIQIASLQQALITQFQTKKTPPLIGLSLDELNTHINQSVSVRQLLKGQEKKIKEKINEQRELFAPWSRLLTLIQLTEDRAPVKLNKIAKIINCPEKQAEHLILLLLKENETIGTYNKKDQVYIKGHDVSVLIDNYIKQVRQIFKIYDNNINSHQRG